MTSRFGEIAGWLYLLYMALICSKEYIISFLITACFMPPFGLTFVFVNKKQHRKYEPLSNKSLNYTYSHYWLGSYCIFGIFSPGAMLVEPALLDSGRPVMTSQVGGSMVWLAGEEVRKMFSLKNIHSCTFLPWCNVSRDSLTRFRAAGHDVTGRRCHGVTRCAGEV